MPIWELSLIIWLGAMFAGLLGSLARIIHIELGGDALCVCETRV